MGNIGSHVNITSERQRHQAKNEAQARSTIFSRDQVRPIARARQPAGQTAKSWSILGASDVSGVNRTDLDCWTEGLFSRANNNRSLRLLQRGTGAWIREQLTRTLIRIDPHDAQE